MCRKYVFDKKFKFDEFPKLLECHNDFQNLINNAYDMEEQYNNGNASKSDWMKKLDKCDNYRHSVFAEAIYSEFKGKNLTIKDWKTKEEYSFDEKFAKEFKDLSQSEKGQLTSLVEIKYGWKLPRRFYK